MAERTTIARPYAEAAFDYARGANAMPEWAQMLRFVEGLVLDARMSEALGSPRLNGEEKAALLLSIAGERLTPEMRNFVTVLVEADRVTLLPEIRQLFDALKDEAEGIAKATIETPIELSADQLAGLTAALERRFGKRVEATVTLNPSLIGGVRITVGDTVIDGSVQAKLDTMAHALRA